MSSCSKCPFFFTSFRAIQKKTGGGNIISEVCSPKICLIESYCNVWSYPFVSSIPHWLLVISILCWSQPLLVRNIPQILLLIPSGKRLHNYGKIHHFLAGKINELNEDQISAPSLCDAFSKRQVLKFMKYGSVSKPCTPGEHQNSW